MATLLHIKQGLRNALLPVYGEGETTAMIRLIFHHLKGWRVTDLIINENKEISDSTEQKINDILERLLKHEPIQYILGEAYFYGLYLDVDRRVLIPRPETEELVDMIVRQNPGSDLRVLDLCTGSGAIAIALCRNLRYADVSALDVSSDAIDVAESNARKLNAKIRFVNQDIFTFMPAKDSFEIIVSNPPYIGESERAGMERNVLDYEPSMALFVPDDNPLVFYSRIAEIAANSLVDGGRLYLEVNALHAEDTARLMTNAGLRNVEIVKDAWSRSRFVVCVKS